MLASARLMTTRSGRRAARFLTNLPSGRRARLPLMLEALEDRTLLSTFTVNSLGDSGTGSGNSGDLRYVINQVNKLDPTTGGTIINFSVTGTITLDSALPDLTYTGGLIDIEGPGAGMLGVAPSSAPGIPSFSVFAVEFGAVVELAGLTVTGSSSDSSEIIYNAGTLTITSSSIANNSSAGIDDDGALTVADSTIANNSIGIYDNFGVAVTVINSTIAGNLGSGIDNGSLTVVNSTIAYSGGGLQDQLSVYLENSIVAMNGEDLSFPIGALGGLVSGSYNLIGTKGSGGLIDGVDGNRVGIVNPGLGRLADNGGPTQTIALLPASPAINVGNNDLAVDSLGNPLLYDQRGPGLPRIFNGTVDIGSYELQVNPAPSLNSISPDRIGVAYPDPLIVTINGADFIPESVVDWNAAPVSTTYVSSTVLTATIPASDFTSIGDASITVINPAPGGGTSDSATFQVLATPQTVYVDDRYSDDPLGTPVIWTDGSAHYIGYDAFSTVQAGVNAVASNGTVDVAAGTYVERVDINESLTLDGAGADLVTVEPNSTGSVFTIDSGVTAVISGLTISGGVKFGDGGGVVNDGTLTLIDCTISGNESLVGGGIFNQGSLALSECSVTGNSVADYFGAPGYYELSFGAGIDNRGSLTITGSTVAHNIAGDSLGGGGISNEVGGTLSVTNSTIANNKANNGGYGAGILDDGVLTLTNCTIAYNSSSNFRPNIGTLGGGLSVNSGTATLDNTIVALNTSGYGNRPDDIAGEVEVMNCYNNLIGTPGSGGLTDGVNGNRVGIPAQLLGLASTLADIGGPTQTIALLASSPAINAGSNRLAVDANGNPLTTDQRGTDFPRPLGDNVDIGAYEAPVPSSYVNTLAKRGSSLSFAVSVTGSDAPTASPSGLTTFDIYFSTNGGPWKLWTTVAASSPTATFSGQSNNTYAFYSTAADQAGYAEIKSPRIEASTYLPDLIPPVTAVNSTTGTNPSTVNTSTGAFTLNLTGSDPGGGVVTYFEVFVSVDSGLYKPAAALMPAGPADTSRNVHATIHYQGLTDGAQHNYAFYSIGFDSAGHTQAAPESPNLTLKETFANATPSQLQAPSLVVENGAVERSYIRYLQVGFNESDSQSGGQLTQIANSINTASPQIQLYQYNLNGDASSKAAVPLSGVTVAVIDHAIELDFGASGLGGSPKTTTADGYYELDVKLPSGTTAVHHFYRLLGDITGDGTVDNNDLNAIAAEINLSNPTGFSPLGADVNGDGTISGLDLTLATRAKGHKLKSGLSLG